MCVCPTVRYCVEQRVRVRARVFRAQNSWDTSCEQCSSPPSRSRVYSEPFRFDGTTSPCSPSSRCNRDIEIAYIELWRTSVAGGGQGPAIFSPNSSDRVGVRRVRKSAGERTTGRVPVVFQPNSQNSRVYRFVRGGLLPSVTRRTFSSFHPRVYY